LRPRAKTLVPFQALQLSGGIPRDAFIPLGSLDVLCVLAAEPRPFPSPAAQRA
jgi:hypothetical protein